MRAGVELLLARGRAEEDGQRIVWKEGR